MKKYSIITVLSLLILLINLNRIVYGCSCAWGGSFLKVSSNSEIIVRAKVLGYHGEARGIKLSMDIEVLEAIKGELNRKTVRVWGDNGALCRPYVTQFPIGTEWILALNGLGSKPGLESGYTISICGTCWLKVENGVVSGNIDNDDDMHSIKKLLLDDFRQYFASSVPKEDEIISGEENNLEADCKRFVEILDSSKFSRDYPGMIKNLLSTDPKMQIVALEGFASTGEPEAIPWIISYLDSPHSYVCVNAGLALEKIVTSFILKNETSEFNRDNNILNLRSLAWVIEKMLRNDDPNIQSYAATMTGYLNLRIFTPKLRQLLNSRHPAVVNSAKEALKKLSD